MAKMSKKAKSGGNKAPTAKKPTPGKAKSFVKAKGTAKDGNTYSKASKGKMSEAATEKKYKDRPL